MDIFRSKKNSAEESGDLQKEELVVSEDEGEKSVEISNKIDPKDEINGSSKDDATSKEFFKKRRKLVKGGVLVAILLFLAGSFWGFGYYEKYAKKVPLKDVLPADAAVVSRLNININSPQFKFLDANFEKFPGHTHVMKMMDNVGEGARPSEFAQRKLKEKGIDFHDDIRSALGDEAYILIPSLDPLESRVRQKISVSKGDLREKLEDYLVLSEDSFEKKFAQEKGDTKVMGAFSDYYILAHEDQNGEFAPLDFILGAEVKDLKKAREVLKKMESDKERYQTSKLEYEGYIYYKIFDKESLQKEKAVLNLDNSFHAIVGSNWVMASCEEQIKKIISIGKANNLVERISSKLPFKKDSVDSGKPLSTDAQYGSFLEGDEGGVFEESQLLSVFFRIDPKGFMAGEDLPDGTGGDLSKYFKYPEKFAASFSVSAQEDGMKFKLNSNRYSLEQKNNSSFMEGLAQKIPNRLDGRWADVYFEYGNPKNIYYSFKRNNLSPEGLEFWDEAKNMLKDSIGVDIEKDFVDQVSGDIALVGYTGKGLEPEGVVVAGIESEERIVATAKKLLELGKQMYLSANPYGGCFGGEPGQANEATGDQVMGNNGSLCVSLDKNPAQKDFVKKQLESVMDSQIRETKNELGTIYSYNLPGTELSFDFSFKDKKAIFGTHYAVVDGMLRELGADGENSIIANKYYKQVASNVSPEGYTKVCLNSYGIWNSVEYYLNQSKLGMSEEDTANLSAVGSIVKTIKLLGSNDTVSAKSGGVMSSLYLNIQELPAKEKTRAEEVIGNW